MSNQCVTCGEVLFEGETVCPACGTPKDSVRPQGGAGGHDPHDPDETGVAHAPVPGTSREPRASGKGPQPSPQPPSAAPARKRPANRPAKKANRPARVENRGLAPEHSARRYFESNSGSGPLAAVGLIVLTVAVIGLSIWVVGGGLSSERPSREVTTTPLEEDDVLFDFTPVRDFRTGEGVMVFEVITSDGRLSDARCREYLESLGRRLAQHSTARLASRRLYSQANYQRWLDEGGRAELRVRDKDEEGEVYYRQSFSVEPR